MGQEVETDDGLEWRVKWGQRGVGVFGLITLIFYVAWEYVATVVFGALTLIFLGVLYYKNVSLVIAKRLLREPNVVIILVLVCVFGCIDIVRPLHSHGIGFYICSIRFVFLDAVKVKSRMFVMGIGTLFLFVLLL